MAVNNPIVRFLTGHKNVLEDSAKAPAIEPGQVLFTIQQKEQSKYKGYIYYDTVDDDGKPIRLMMSGEGGSSFSEATILDKDKNYGATVVVGDSSELELPLPDYINTNYFYASEIIPLNHTLLKGADAQKDTGKGKTYFHGSGMLMVSPYYTHQEGLVRIIGESSSKPDITVEIATRDLYTDDNINTQIVARQYDKNNNILREAKLLTRKGDSEFPGDILLTKENGNIWWTSGEVQQRIRSIDDKKSDSEVFVFEQSTDTGKTWDTLMTIRDNGKVLAEADLVSLNGIVRAIEGSYGALLYNDGSYSGIYLTDKGSEMGAADVENPPFSVRNSTGNVGIGAEPDPNTTYKLTVYGSQEIYDTTPILNIHSKTNNPGALSFENGDYKRNIITANHINNEGFNVVIDAGGNMYLGSGASATQLYESQKTSTTEKLYLVSDEEVFIESNANTLIGNRIGVAVDKKGNFYPVAAEANHTNNQTLGIGGTTSPSRWKAVYIGTEDSYGSSTQPIYWNNGVPTATKYFLKASVSQGSDKNRLAYYLTDTEIAQTSHFANETQIGVNYTDSFTQALYVNGTTFFNGNVTHQGNILPSKDNAYDIGSTSAAWKDAFFKGIVRASQIGTGYPAKTAAADGKDGAWLDSAGNIHLTSSSAGNTINFYWKGGTKSVAKITMPETGTLEVTDRLTVGYNKSKMFYEGADQSTAETFAVNGTGFFLDTLRSKGSIVTNDGTVEVRSDSSNAPYVKLSSSTGTTTTTGIGILELGNNIAKGKVDNATGKLIMYGEKTNKKLEITTTSIPSLTLYLANGQNYYTNDAGATDTDFWQISTNGQDLRFLSHDAGSATAKSSTRYITFFDKGGVAINDIVLSKTIAGRTDDAKLFVNGGTVIKGLLTASSWIMVNKTDSAGGYFYNRIDNIDYATLGASTKGTTSVVGVGILTLGNYKASGEANNARGLIRVYGTSTKYTDIVSQAEANYTVYLPNYKDNMYLTHVADNDAVGGVYKGTYVAASGRITPMTYELKATVNNGTANRMAYYSGANAISSTNHYTSASQVAINSTSKPTQTFYVNGTSYFSNTAYFNANVTHHGHILVDLDNQLDLGSQSKEFRANYVRAIATRHIDADAVYSDDSDLYIGYNSLAPTSAIKMYYSNATDRTHYFEVNSNGAYALKRFGVNGQNTGYNFYVNGTSYFSGYSNVCKVYNSNNYGSSSSVTFTNLAAYNGSSTGMIYAATDNPLGKGSWCHTWSQTWNNGVTSSWVSQIALGVENGSGMWYRCTSGNIAGRGWNRVLDSSNYTSYVNNYYWANIKVSTSSNASTAPTFNTCYTPNWFRSTGNSGWYNESYGGGIYMTDSTYVRVYNSKHLKADNEIISTTANGFRLAYGSKPVLLRNDGSNFYFLICTSASPGNNWATPSGASAHPFRLNLSTGYIYTIRTYSAVWNDYAEYRRSKEEEPGRVVMEDKFGVCQRATDRLQSFAGVVSDTFGFSQGETKEAKTPLAVAGRVLVYTYQNRNNYKPGDCVCAAPDGTVDIMTREEISQWPDRIVGTVSEIPTYDIWGEGKVKVNGRIWIKVK